MALRAARLLPPKRLLTPRSARRLSAANRGLLPGFPAITRVGLAPTGLVQLSGRNIPEILRSAGCHPGYPSGECRPSVRGEADIVPGCPGA